MRTGRVEAAGTGVVGITVSDGLHVTRTGADGTFVLPAHGPFVTLTRPSGYRAARWFAPADDADDLIFELSPVAQPQPFEFVQITDLHLSLGDRAFGEGQGDATAWFEDGRLRERVVTTPQVLAALLGELAARHSGAAFIVATGDLTNTGADDELAAWQAAADDSPLPVVAIPGNHDHMSLRSDRPPLWEAWLGPRWFSFEHGGVHFAAIDWFTYLLGMDADVQERWLAADLAAVAPDTPVVLLTHDQMPSAFFAALPRRPVATFSGHWHTSRVVEAGGTRHYNTGTATFGGLDYSPAHYRVATWDGRGLAVRTVARGNERCAGVTFRCQPAGAPRDGLRWSSPLAGAAHLGEPVVRGQLVLVASRGEDEPRGALEAFEAATGALRWSLPFSSALKAAPVVIGDLVIAAAVTGEVKCASVDDGQERWRVELDDPLLLWVYLRPASDGRLVFVGDVARFSALGLADGSVAWSRADLGQRENLTSFAHPVVVDGTLLVGFAGQVPHLWGLDPATGATRWPLDASRRSIYRHPPAEAATLLPRVLVGGISPDPDGSDVYVTRLGARVERLRAATGEVVWSAPFLGWFNPAPPVVVADAVVAVAATGEVHCFDRASGRRRWRREVSGAAPVAMGSYRDSGGALLAPVTPLGAHLLVPCGDGRVVAVRAGDGEPVGEADLGAPVTTAMAVADDVVIAACADGVARALPIDAILPDPGR